MDKQRGFTLIELMVATTVTAILAATAYPSFQGPILKARRSDGLTALLQLQMSQERWRSDHASYATLAELRLASVSPMGHYQLSLAEATPSGFVATATATGSQARDEACKVLRVEAAGGNAAYTSGTDENSHNSSAVNKRCWNL